MKTQKWMIAPALALALGTGAMVQAAKGPKTPRQERMQMLTPELLGKVLGAPLTDAQTRGVEDAQLAYEDSVAKAVGLTTDELRAKVIAYRQMQRDQRRGLTPAPLNPNTTNTAPATTTAPAPAPAN